MTIQPSSTVQGHLARPGVSAGFTLIEMVMVILILGVIAATVAVFMKHPIDAYVDVSRRAALTDVADTALRRMASDIPNAVPNTVRTPSKQCVEFIPMRAVGFYRAGVRSDGTGDPLGFGVTDTSFGVYLDNAALPADRRIRANDVVVVNNLGVPGADAYAGDNTATVSSVTSGAESVITFPARQFPRASDSRRFHVVPGDAKIVSFACSGDRLLRSSNHAYGNSCPVSGATVSVLADHVLSCDFSYDGADRRRQARVRLTLVLGDKAGGESISLYQALQVDNTP